MSGPNRAHIEADLVAFAELAPTLGRNAAIEMTSDVAEQLGIEVGDVGDDPRCGVDGHATECNCDQQPGWSAVLPDDEPPPPPKKKRKKATPTTARTLAHCRKLGWIAGVVERRIPFPKPQGTKFDLFGVIDVVAVIVPTAAHHPWEDHGGDGPCAACWKPGAIGIQSAANIGGHHAKHRDKILAEPRARAWLEAGNRLELWAWAKQGRGKRKLWTLRVEAFTADSPWMQP